MDPGLVSQAIHSVFGMKLYIASAVLLTPMNSGFVSVISLETAKKKAKLFVPDEKKKPHHMQVTYSSQMLKGVFPLRPYHHQEVEKNKPIICQQNASRGDIISTASVAPEGHPYIGICQFCTRVTASQAKQAGLRRPVQDAEVQNTGLE